jgi:hypothetical protein
MKSWTRSLLVLAVGLCCSWVAVAGPDDPTVVVINEDSPVIDRFRSDLVKVRSMLRNANMKFKRGVTGGISENLPELKGPPTPGKACCAGNIVHLDKLFKRIDGQLAELRECYESAGDVGGTDTLDLVQRDLQQVKRGVHLFQTMEDSSQVYQALGGTQRAFLLLDESQRDLPGCEQGQ